MAFSELTSITFSKTEKDGVVLYTVRTVYVHFETIGAQNQSQNSKWIKGAKF